MIITKPIIPVQQTFVKVNDDARLDLKAICVFTAIGFFLESDTYWKDRKVLAPGTKYQLDDRGYLSKSEPYFKWYYEPNNVTFDQALEQFSSLFETIVSEQTKNKQVILPLSGGLDSRTQAVALKHKKDQVFAYSYKYARGFNEVKIAQELATIAEFRFKKFEIPQGYLWKELETLVQLNKCTSDFTSPRQLAVREKFQEMGEIFSLGHWGDVLFDDMGVEDNLSFDSQVEVIEKKLLKSGGMELAETLWELWELEGSFKAYFHERVKDLLGAIDISRSANARIRAFKSLYWAPRWTSVNLSVFESVHPITLPYYDNRMCEFICTMPEEFLKDRQLQIAYIKTKEPKMAKVIWQDKTPFNLTNYQYNKVPYNLPYRITSKMLRTLKGVVGKPYVMRNWELQFLGSENKKALSKIVYNKEFLDWIPKQWVDKVVNEFYQNPKPSTAHPLNMILVLAKFNESKDLKTIL